VNFGELAYPDVTTDAVHLLPLGATEPHGPHAPLSTDTLISVGICDRAAERLEGEIRVLVLPAVPYGVTRYGSTFPGAVSIGEETLRSLVTEIAETVGPLVLADRPDLVHSDRMLALEERHVDMPAAIRAGQTNFVAMGMVQAYCGSPAEASAEEGRQTFETLTEMLVALIREVAA